MHHNWKFVVFRCNSLDFLVVCNRECDSGIDLFVVHRLDIVVPYDSELKHKHLRQFYASSWSKLDSRARATIRHMLGTRNQSCKCVGSAADKSDSFPPDWQELCELEGI